MENPKINLHTYGKGFFEKSQEHALREMTVYSINGAEHLYTHKLKKETRCLLLNVHNSDLKIDRRHI